MIRALTVLDTACLIGAVIAVLVGEEMLAAILALAFVLLTVVLTIRRLYVGAREAVSDARAFLSGDVQKARIVDVGDPKGWLNPKSGVVLELEAEDGTKRQFDREFPIPFALAWGYRLSKRFKVPMISERSLTETLSFELRREGVEVTASRPT